MTAAPPQLAGDQAVELTVPKIIPLDGARRTFQKADEEAERVLLGLILYDQAVYDQVGADLVPDHFQLIKHRWIYEAMEALRTAGEPVDFVTVQEELAKADRLSKPEEKAYILGLIEDVSDTHLNHVGIFQERVLHASHRAQLHAILSDAAKDLSRDANDLPALLQRLEALDRARLRDDQQDTFTVADLYRKDFPDPVWIVPDLLPEGLAVLAGNPKIGKSVLGLQVATAVASGGKLFDRDVEAGPVLYLALEDNPRRIKKRLHAQGVPPTELLTFKTNWPTAEEGGIQGLIREVAAGRHRLIVVDTWGRLMGALDQNRQHEVVPVIGALQQAALLASITVLILDHHTKATRFTGAADFPDPILDVLGSVGKTGVVDTALGIYAQQGTRDRRLVAVGRDIDRQDLMMAWDGQTLCWQLVGDTDQVRQEGTKDAILTAVRELTDLGELPTTTAIARHAGGKDTGNVSREIAKMVTMGALVRGRKHGRKVPYYLPDDSEEK